ncbi:MAG: DUF5618 family protein [Emticicia sp.]|nr:DUF5618 family protein [Emticicia sp.]
MEIIQEANRYLDNARQILSEKANKENGLYQDREYVKMAGHTAYSGVLLALDGVLGTKIKGRKSVEWYKSELSKVDKKITSLFDAVYDTLHLSLAYDGNPSAKVAQAGLEDAEKIIKWVEQKKQP